MKRKFILAGSVAGALIAAGAAYGIVAHATAAGQTITACVAPDGSMRLATAAGDCKKNETVLTWDSVGPAGAAGVPGQNGLNGQNGQNGQNGLNAVDPDAVAATITVNKGAVTIADGLAVSAISHEVVLPRDAAGSGAATGRPVHKPITVTMAVGASTPQLIGAALTNSNLSTVVLTFGSPSETITLTGATISDYQQHGDAVMFSFGYEKIKWANDSSSFTEDLNHA